MGKLNIIDKVTTLSLETYLTQERLKLGQAVNPTSNVQFNNISSTGDIVTIGNVKSDGLIIGNLVNINATGITVSKPTLVLTAISNVTNLTQSFSSLAIQAATTAVLSSNVTFQNTSSTGYGIFRTVVPGVPLFTSVIGEPIVVDGKAMLYDTNEVIEDILFVPVVGTNLLEIRVLNPYILTTIVVQMTISYTFLSIPIPYDFIFHAPNPVTVKYGTLTNLGTYDILDFNFVYTVAVDGVLTSVELDLPDLPQDFENGDTINAQIFGQNEQGYVLDNTLVEPIIGTSRALIQWVGSRVITGENYLSVRIQYFT